MRQASVRQASVRQASVRQAWAQANRLHSSHSSCHRFARVVKDFRFLDSHVLDAHDSDAHGSDGLIRVMARRSWVGRQQSRRQNQRVDAFQASRCWVGLILRRHGKRGGAPEWESLRAVLLVGLHPFDDRYAGRASAAQA